ncbi:MAG: TetR/AcrR family transcriptional regulator [Bacteroidota bacterium]
MKTRDRILDQARRLFNERGLEKVTVRDICDALEISPGNFTYYFKGKTLVVWELYEQMMLEIYALAGAIPLDHSSVRYFLEAHKGIFFVQEKYRFFYLNLFQIFTHYPAIREAYLQRYEQEKAFARQLLVQYAGGGVLIKDLSEGQMDKLINVGYVLNNSWLLDAELHFRGDRMARLKHYLQLCCGRLEPYLTQGAKGEYEAYFDQLELETVPE